MAMLYGPRTKQELDAALVPFRRLRNKYRRRYEKDNIALTQDEAVEAYKLVAPLYAPDMTKEEAALQAVLNAIAFSCFETGGFGFRGPAVEAILEGFERMIAEGSQTLHIRHQGETEAREVDPWSRFVAYEALKHFVGLMDAEQRARDADPRAPRIRVVDGDRDSLLDRAQAILANKLPVTRPRGRYDPRLTLRRNAYIVAMLAELGGCGLKVTSSKVTSLEGESLAGALAEAIDVSESVIAKVWKDTTLRSRQLYDALPPDQRIPESLIRDSRELYAPGVPCVQCGAVGKVPKYRAPGSGLSCLCTDCKPRRDDRE